MNIKFELTLIFFNLRETDLSEVWKVAVFPQLYEKLIGALISDVGSSKYFCLRESSYSA